MTLFSPHGEPLQNPYEILGLNRGATDDEINKAYKKLMLKLHPDKQPPGQSEEEAASVAKTFHDVMDAKSFLLDVEHMSAKRAYDSKLAGLENRARQKLVIPSFSNMPDKSSKKGPKRRNSDCTDDRRPNIFKKAERRVSLDDCSTTGQSSSDDDAPRNSKGGDRSSREKRKQDVRNQRGPRQTVCNAKSSHQRNGSMPNAHHQRNGSVTNNGRSNGKTCKKANSFSESCSSFFTDKDPKMTEWKSGRQSRKHSMDHKRPSLNSNKPPSSPTQGNKLRVSIPSSSTTPQPSNPTLTADHQAKQRITHSIDLLSKKFTCPLTKEIMTDPMTDFEGNSYEREAILKYLEGHSTSPVTGSPLYACHLTGNAVLKEKIRYTMELKRTLESLGAAETKEMKHATTAKHHSSQHPESSGTAEAKNGTKYHSSSSQHPAAKTASSKRLRESIDAFITDLNSGSPSISMSNLDETGTTTFSYLGIKFKLEVSDSKSSFTVQTSFDHNKRAASISARLVDWNKALQEFGLGGCKLTFRFPTFALSKSMENEEFKPRLFRYSIEYFLEFAIKLHNMLNVNDLKSVGKVRLSASG